MVWLMDVSILLFGEYNSLAFTTAKARLAAVNSHLRLISVRSDDDDDDDDDDEFA